MKFNFKSLFQSNVVFVLDPQGFRTPDNAAFNSLFEGEAGSGARFVDDPVIESKFLNVPKQQLRIALEGTRLRIDDDSKHNPDETRVLAEAVRIYQKLFPNGKLAAYGFNFDFFYRFPNVIQDQMLLTTFASESILKKARLKDLGVQFALEKENGKVQEVYFLKITAPIEMAVHYNFHTAAKELPKMEKLDTQFRQAYEAPDAMVEQLKL